MLSAQITNAYFTVAGQKLPVAHFTLTESICRPTELTLSLSPGQGQDPLTYIGQSTQFKLESFSGEERVWHLVCEAVQENRLICRSRWNHLFKEKRTQRVFCQIDLIDLARSFFNHSEWSLSHEDWIKQQIVQAAESDGEFLQRILGRENIQWVSCHTQEHEVLHFVDHPSYFPVREAPLNYCPDKGIVDLDIIQRGPLNQDEWLDEMPLRLYSGIPCVEAGVRSSGMPVKSYQPLSYEPDALQKILQARKIDQADLPKTGYRALRFQSRAMDLSPGLVIHCPVGSYRVNYVKHSGVSEQAGEGATLRYQNMVIAQDSLSPWRGLLDPAPLMPLVFQAKIESAHENPHLDDNGRETIRSLLDSNKTDPLKASIPLPRLTPYAHAKGGFQCPLYPGTEVLMTCLHGEADLPVILGCVFNQEQPSPVNQANPYLNLFRTQQYQEWRLDDTPSAPFMQWSTQSGHQLIMRNALEPGFFITCVGGMILSSRGQMTWETGQDFISQVGGEYLQRAGQGQTIKTDTGNLSYQASLDCQIHALNNIECESKQNTNIVCQNHQVKISQGQTITLIQGDAKLNIQGVSLVEVRDQIILSSLSGDLILTNQSGVCGIKLTQNGQISLYGKQLLTNIELEKNVGTINHAA